MAWLANKLNLPFAGHEYSNGTRLSRSVAKALCNHKTWDGLGKESNNADEDCVTPGNTVVQKTKVSFETGESKVLLMQFIVGVRPGM
jgi:hypothetical protein